MLSTPDAKCRDKMANSNHVVWCARCRTDPHQLIVSRGSNLLHAVRLRHALTKLQSGLTLVLAWHPLRIAVAKRLRAAAALSSQAVEYRSVLTDRGRDTRDPGRPRFGMLETFRR